MVDKKPLSTKIDEFLTLINEFGNEPKSSLNLKDPSLFSDQEQERANSEKRTKFVKFVFNAIDPNETKSGKKSIGIKEISKKIPRWSHKLITELDQQLGEFKDRVTMDHQIRLRKARRVVIFTDNNENKNPEPNEEVALISYSQQSDFRRGIIKGSMRAQRRKTSIWKLFQANAHSPLFLDRITPPRLFSFDISGLIKPIFRNWTGKEGEFKILKSREEQTKREEKKEKDKKEENKRKEKARIAIAEAWDTIPFAQIIRGYMLITQSILRKYIILPSLIIAKNLGRMLFFQLPEWSEDLQEWKSEMHIKCTYNGVQLSETEFPKNWLRDGIQIKILFPFCLKPWHISKLYPSRGELIKKKKQKDDFCFLTVWGMEAELPFELIIKKIHFIFISTIKKSLYNISKKNSHIFFDLSYLSQAYVFYKLSQTQIINLSKFRSVLQYNRTPFFLKTKIKDYFRTLGIFHSELKDKKLQSYRINQWKNWLRRHYQYDLSQIRWSRLMPKKWRTRVNQSCMVQNKNRNLNKWNSYEKDQLIHYKKENDSELYSLSNQKDNFKKCYSYDLLSYKSINYENKSDSFISRLSFQVNKNFEISYNYNTSKHNFFDMPVNLHINNYLRKGNILDIKRKFDRKYFDWKIIHFSVRQKGDIEAWVKIDTNSNPNTKIGINNYQIIDKIDKKGLFYLTTHQNPEKTQKNSKKERGSDIENKGNLVPVFSKHQNDLEKDYAESDTNKKTKQYKRNTEAELYLFLKRYLLFQLRWNDALNQRMLENIKVYCLLLRLINPTKITISSIQRREMRLDIMLIQANLTLTELMKKGVFIIEPIRLSVKNNGQFIMYQTIGISLVHKSKHQTNQRYREQRYVDKKNFDEFILQPQNQRINTDKNHFDLLVPENILWSRRRRELRIRSFFNSLNWNGVDRNSVFCNETNVKNWSQFLDERKPLYKEKNELIKFKFFIWPNYRLEDLACMNRYWFDTNNGSRFSILRIHMYPQLKIN
ncbi:unnamed protein product [Withania somnifera]